MAVRRGSNRERERERVRRAEPGCQKWTFVDMVMSLMCVCVQMVASSKGAFGFVLLFCVVSFLRLFPVSLSPRLPFVLTWGKFCYQMGTRSPFRVSFHRLLSSFSPSFFSPSLHSFICIHMDLFIWKRVSFIRVISENMSCLSVHSCAEQSRECSYRGMRFQDM